MRSGGASVLTRERVSGAIPVENARAQSKSSFRFGAGGKEYVLQIANTRELREESFRLMHEIYERVGYGKPHSSGMWYTLYELLPDSVTITVSHKEEVIGTMSVVFDSPFGLPDDKTYPDEIDKQRFRGRRLSQVISLGIKPDVSEGLEMLVRLFNMGYLVAKGVRRATDFLITVVPQHAPFYIRKMLFTKLGEAKFQKKTDVDVVLLNLDFVDAETESHLQHGPQHLRPANSRAIYRHFDSVMETPGLVTRLRKTIRPITEKMFWHFIAKRPELWSEATPRQKEYLTERILGTRRARRRSLRLPEPECADTPRRQYDAFAVPEPICLPAG